MWILIKNQTTPQESETLTCDYDSELEMRYSEMESENESGTEDSTNDSSEDNTGDFSEDDDEYNDSSKEEDVQSSTEFDLQSEEEEALEEEEEEAFIPEMANHPSSDKLEELENEIGRIYEISDALENSYKSGTATLSKHEELSLIHI